MTLSILNPILNRTLVMACLAIIVLATSAHADHGEANLQLLVQIRNPEIVTRANDGSITVDNRASRLVETVVAEADIDYQVQVYPWARIMQELNARKNVIAFPIARTPEREDSMHWVGMIRAMEMNLYGLRDRASQLPQSFEEARQSDIGVIRGDFVDHYLADRGFTQLVRLNNLDNALTLLDRRRFSLFPFEARGVAEMLQQNNLPNDYLLPIISLPGASTEIFFAVSTHTDSHIKELLEAAYQRVVEDGRYEQIMGMPHNSRFQQ